MIPREFPESMGGKRLVPELFLVRSWFSVITIGRVMLEIEAEEAVVPS